MPPSWLFILMVLTAVVFVAVAMSPRKKSGLHRGRKTCAQCGADNPGFAQFCRRCGQSLWGISSK